MAVQCTLRVRQCLLDNHALKLDSAWTVTQILISYLVFVPNRPVPKDVHHQQGRCPHHLFQMDQEVVHEWKGLDHAEQAQNIKHGACPTID